ncbi:MAG: hypothetical protein AABZ31_11455 [Bdellovibrionota bacterium]
MVSSFRFLFLGGLIFFATAVLAAPPELLNEDIELELPTMDEIKALTIEKQDLYWLGLRQLILELNENDETTDADYAHQNPTNWIIREAYAIGSGVCIYAGWVKSRPAGQYCPRPEACAGQPNRIQCNPLLYGPDVCVSPGRRATSSCEKSSRALGIVRGYREKNPESWQRFRTQVQDYCRKGRQASVCRMVRSRLGEIRESAQAYTLPAIAPRVRAVSSTPSPSSASVSRASSRTSYSAPTGTANDSEGGCLSDMLVQGIRISGNETHQFINPEVAHRAFCVGDIEYLKQVKTTLLKDAQRQITRSESARSKAGPRYERERLNEQTRRLKSGLNIIKKCIALVESGKKVPSRHSGTLEFNGNIVSFRGTNGLGGELDALNLGISLSLLSRHCPRDKYKRCTGAYLGGRFCDYSLITNGSSYSPSGTSGSPAESVK